MKTMTAKNELTAKEIRFMSQILEALEPQLKKLVKDITITCIEYTKWIKAKVTLDMRSSSMQTFSFGINASCIKVLADIVATMAETLKEFKVVIQHVELQHWDRGMLKIVATIENPFPEDDVK